jgi:lactoylglutathione lyase
MRTLHLGLRVAHLERSLAFYTALGYEVVGEVPETSLGHLTMLKLPDDPFVTLELVHNPDDATADLGSGLSHFVIQVESLRDFVSELASRDVAAGEPKSPDGAEDFLTSWLTDPDGRRIELVQWPPGHASGMTETDFTS